jgi:GNAT superfamily N-acetyltransferase
VRVEIKEIDVFDDDTLRASYLIMREADLFERPHAPVWSFEEAAVMYRHQEETEDWHVFAAYDDDTIVGSGWLVMFTMDNVDKAFTKVYVAPDLRRRGIGGALLDYAVDTAALEGRTTVVAETAYPFDRRADHPHRRFLEKHGFVHATTEVARQLPLPVPEEQLQAWIDEAAPKHAGYRIQSMVGPVPDDIVPSLCHVLSLLAAEAPTGDLDFEPETITPAIWREREAKIAEQGRTVFTTVALDDAGQAVAATQLAVPEHDFPKVYQWATLVLREHRGHRLGLALKAHNLRAVQQAHPDRTLVWTCNEETNGPMVDINVKMGFVPLEVLGGFQRKVTS